MGLEGHVSRKELFYDIDGLLVNLGVVSALLLSFTVGIFVEVDEGRLDRMDFRANLQSPRAYETGNFTDFVIGTMDECNPKFRWNITWYGQDVQPGEKGWFDVKSFLEEYGRTAPEGRLGGARDFKNSSLTIASHVLTAPEAFPMDRMRAWASHQRRLTGRTWRHLHAGSSESLLFFSIGAATFQALALLISLFYYVSLSFSSSRVDVDALFVWWRFGFWPLLAGYFFLILGSVFFYKALTDVAYLTYPDPAIVWRILEIFFFGILISVAVVTLGSSISLTILTTDRGQHWLKSSVCAKRMCASRFRERLGEQRKARGELKEKLTLLLESLPAFSQAEENFTERARRKEAERERERTTAISQSPSNAQNEGSQQQPSQIPQEKSEVLPVVSTFSDALQTVLDFLVEQDVPYEDNRKVKVQKMEQRIANQQHHRQGLHGASSRAPMLRQIPRTSQTHRPTTSAGPGGGGIFNQRLTTDTSEEDLEALRDPGGVVRRVGPGRHVQNDSPRYAASEFGTAGAGSARALTLGRQRAPGSVGPAALVSPSNRLAVPLPRESSGSPSPVHFMGSVSDSVGDGPSAEPGGVPPAAEAPGDLLG
uniref:Uncharacterized protein n=1 Tax=Chromera velia CCMP2878 TaxID=1169474 RepID=A0A0G4HD03_9ALVE|mmetsp:Transcript_17146/g.34765  ORF Transcript_17146/g.34765 Transcript_17146/m.34765 type:complete len:596 (-) Transcript_17146:84-1871(-)|eukprot:Cvel_6342.t1-p1 / transcript=Cvel_6342.t1 / gene=Cvel_6342 / organism=Chromera_velia_CCMP2878 / gene_product=hypothetical protein / transcript_product=hypothetical protein / location=Cvel_scaffold308:18373-21065(+) / protein_length=595 / sequence_SO=supercontig / SO=protein_coding / is_pseudo=false